MKSKKSNRNRIAGLLRIPAAAVGILTALTVLAASNEIRDLDITLAVDTQLKNDAGVPAQMIDVQTRDGVVTLSGTVPHLLAKERADDVAATVMGVRSIVNRINVFPLARTDELIRREVQTALLDDPATDLFKLEVSVQDGVVTLGGLVNSWQEKQLCVKVAKGVRGVREVRSEITVSQAAQRPDAEIAAEIDRKLAYDVWVRDEGIDVKVRGGHVMLNGVVGSLAEEKRAFMDAWVAGVAGVDDTDLLVDPLQYDAKMRRVEKPVLKPDDEVRQAVKDAFAYDPRVSHFEVQVRADSGIVTLTGQVDNMAAKRAAGEDAHNTTGVWQVKNHIKVRPGLMGPQRRPLPDVDTEMADKIRAVLARHPYVQQHEIGVTVNNRIAVLSGTVDSGLEKQTAGEAASRVRGIADVVNNLKLSRDWEPKEDWQISRDIRNELWWSPFVDEDDIIVKVSDGVASLTGAVDTLRDRRIATVNAYEGGARQVRNHLKVRFGPEALRP